MISQQALEYIFSFIELNEIDKNTQKDIAIMLEKIEKEKAINFYKGVASSMWIMETDAIKICNCYRYIDKK